MAAHIIDKQQIYKKNKCNHFIKKYMYYIREEILSLAYNVHTTPEELKKSLAHFGFVFEEN